MRWVTRRAISGRPWKAGAVRVGLDGVGRGQTVMDQCAKHWHGENQWTAADRPKVTVALDVNTEVGPGHPLQREPLRCRSTTL
jgi:hypothetical protein